MNHEVLIMVALFQMTTNDKSFMPTMQKLKPSLAVKWVPVNKSFITLCKIILRSAVERLNLSHAAITLRCVTHQGYRHLLLVDDERDMQLASFGPVEEFLISTQEANSSPFEDFIADSAYSVALNVVAPNGLSQRLGYLVVQAGPGTTFQQSQINQQLHDLADEITRIIGRYQTRYRAMHVFGDQHYWIGNGPALRQLDERIDLLAKGNQPVLIRGNKGSGKIIAARSLHCLCCPQTAPFVESDCKDWSVGSAAKVLHSLHHSANGGTLFLRNVNMLFSTDFQSLRNFWRRIAGDQFEGRQGLRLVMSLSRKDTELASYQSNWFAQQCAELVLPDLSERREDRRDLAQFYLAQFALIDCDLTEAAWELLETTDALNNVEQLKTIMQKLTLVAEGEMVSVDELRALLS
jgi:transcriptional regulator with PAS, ATPase and Fis domain